ncbi:MAG: cellulose biosynthesis protein BcsE [Stenotrophobium sp.]
MLFRKPRSIPLGVDGLPPTARMMRAGSLYALVEQHTGATLACIAGSVAEALKMDRRTVVVTADGDALLQALAQLEIDSQRALSRGWLRIYIHSTDAPAQCTDARQYLDEFDYYDIGYGSLLIINDASALYDWTAPKRLQRQARQYRRWCREGNVTCLQTFPVRASTIEKPIGMLRGADASFAGLACLRLYGETLSWETLYWRVRDGALVSREYGLQLDTQGQLLAANGLELHPRERRLLLASDSSRVIATVAAVRGDSHVPPEWQIVPDYAALLSAAEDAVSATCILHNGSLENFSPLATAVHALRQRAGKALKIIVRERQFQLRHSHERMLLHLGANAVAYLELNMSRLLGMVESLRDQVYHREVSGDLNDALAAVISPMFCGYMRPAEFAAAVSGTLARHRELSLESALVRLPLLPEVAHLTALRACKISRYGDLFTADARSVYLFLFGCREFDVAPTVDRLFNPPVAELFEGQINFPGTAMILPEIENLARRAETGDTADYSDMLPLRRGEAASSSEQRPVNPPEIAAAPAQRWHNAPVDAAKPAPQPRRVEREALPLKSGRAK